MQNANNQVGEQEPDLSNVPVTALESLRLRLVQLTHSLGNLQNQLHQATLPSWPALQGQFNVILTQLTSLTSTIGGCAELLQRTVAYPLPKFPVPQQGLLTTLLRKKNAPQVDEWVESGQNDAKDLVIRQDDEFCSWANSVVENARDNCEWSGFLTREQLDSGIKDTGLMKKTESDNGWPVEQVLTFISKGETT